jgi:3-oxoacyl-[acyl-carrier-protein] synthase III
MGVEILHMRSFYEYEVDGELTDYPGQVFDLAQKVVRPLLDEIATDNISHLIVATTCPDQLAPSLSQLIMHANHDKLSDCISLDLVQGCAGGIMALITASNLAESLQTSVMVVLADAARKAASEGERARKYLGNGSFACIINGTKSPFKKMLHSKSRQYKDLKEVVEVKLGQDASEMITTDARVRQDPRKYLGFHMDIGKAVVLLHNAEIFYLEFIAGSCKPEVMILHQVNPTILKHLNITFSKYGLEFINTSALTGNCGTASVGIAMELSRLRLKGKKVMICSFGTGGLISAGLWQM